MSRNPHFFESSSPMTALKVALVGSRYFGATVLEALRNAPG